MNRSVAPERLVRPGFARRAALAVLLAVGLGLVLQIATADGPDAVSGGVGGDYASFYAAGGVVRGDLGLSPERLYDPPTQFEAQEPVLRSDSEGNLYFAYPAFFVAPYVALSALQFGLSYLLHTAFMAGALLGSLVLLRPMVSVVRSHLLEVFAVALTFFPLFRGVTGGQNTALSVLLIAIVWRSLHDDREVRAGMAAALLLFKPPLALPFLGALILARRWRAVGSALTMATALYLVGALVTGPSWPSRWLDAVRYLDRVDTPFNVQNFVSVPGAAEAIFGIDSTAATIFGFGLAAVAVVVVSCAWLRGVGDLDGRIALTTAGALLISPHALYYDAGLLVLVGLVLLDRNRVLRRWWPVLWAFGFAQLAADALGVSPLVLPVVGAFLAAGDSLLKVRSERSTPATVP